MSATKTRRAARPTARRRGSALQRWLLGSVWNEIFALLLLAATALLLISLLSYHAGDPAPLFGPATGKQHPSNAAGRVGAFVAAAAFQLLGVAAYLLPVGTFLLAWQRLSARGQLARLRPRLIGGGLMLLSFTGLLALWAGDPAGPAGTPSPGGMVGTATAAALVSFLNSAGAFVVLLTSFFLSLLVATRFSLQGLLSGAGRGSEDLLRQARMAWIRMAEQRRRRRLQKKAVQRQLEKPPAEPVVKNRRPRRSEEAEEETAVPGTQASLALGAAQGTLEEPEDETEEEEFEEGEEEDEEGDEELIAIPADEAGDFSLPPLSLLKEGEEEHPVDEAELVAKAKLLTAKLDEFGVGGTVTAIHPGPVITTFEFKPDAGIKVSKVTNLVDDLSLALKAESVRIDRLAGRSTIGIEVPNRERETIRIREILEAEAYVDNPSRLPLALGKTIDGRPYATALERMPHLLIAGATGSGKSVALNSMIASILFRARPDQVKFIFIDPKMLELGIYEDIPHLICPVVTDATRAARVLRWACQEMTRRYELLFGHGVRNLKQFNTMAAGAVEAGEVDEDSDLRPLPYLVVVIDELADLMMVSSKEVEAAIQRLAQMARAVGIHLIIATQRPSVDVLTGVIKANFPCRIAFRVSSRTDSNVILDQKGAERLLGMGDMLFLPPGAASLVRIHGALMEEAEALRIIANLKQQGKPVFNDDILREEEEEMGPTGLPVLEKDVLFDKAARLVVSMGQASVSHLQRRLGLGYARAARLMDSLEADGIVGPSEGSKPREVLVPPDYFEEIDAAER